MNTIDFRYPAGSPFTCFMGLSQAFLQVCKLVLCETDMRPKTVHNRSWSWDREMYQALQFY